MAIAVGDKIRIVKKIEKCDNNMNSWVPAMDKAIGKTGVIKDIRNDGCRVEIEGFSRSYIFSPESLEPFVEKFYFLEGTSLVYKKVATGSKYSIFENFMGQALSSKNNKFVEAPEGTVLVPPKETDEDLIATVIPPEDGYEEHYEDDGDDYDDDDGEDPNF